MSKAMLAQRTGAITDRAIEGTVSDAPLVFPFLEHLEKARGNSARKRKATPAAGLPSAATSEVWLIAPIEFAYRQTLNAARNAVCDARQACAIAMPLIR
jgi:hypothetical protein